MTDASEVHVMPCESTIRWAARKIEGVWCVGMEGNLDFLPDSALRITGGWLTDETARAVAESVAEQHNAAIDAAALGADAAADESVPVTIDDLGIAEARIQGTWQGVTLRVSVTEDPDDSWLSLQDDEGRQISIACDVMEKALPLLVRFGRTGMLHTVVEVDQDPSVVEAFMAAVDGNAGHCLVSSVDDHYCVLALSGDEVVRLYGDTEMPYTGSAADIQAILDDGACFTRPR